jgi:hypothetical protein
MPKTGGTFVTSVLCRLHNSVQPALTRYDLIRHFLLSILPGSQTHWGNSSNLYGPLVDLEPKHGTCHDIPAPHRNKSLLSTVRNPYDWYVSQYEFGWWKRTFIYHPESQPTPVGFAIEQVLPEFIEENPHFPDISFSEFVKLCYRASQVYNNDYRTDLGLYTHGFVQFYYWEPSEVISKIAGDYICSGRHRLDMFDICFIKTHRLNQELYDFLLSMEYQASDLNFLPELGKIFPMGRGRQDDQKWEGYYTSDLKKFIREKEWALFEMFPDFDI